VNGDGGGITLPVGAAIGSGRFLLLVALVVLSFEHDEQLLDRDDFVLGEDVREESAGAVEVKEAELAEELTDSLEGCEVSDGFSGKVNRVLDAADIGLIRVGESFERKSRYAAGGVIGVF
jgi:hypothetical protein